MKVIIVIPTYNERENLRDLLPQVLSVDSRIEVLVVDDASPDGTASLVEEMRVQNPRVHLIRRAGKMGLGSAYVAGFARALELGADLVFEMDADFSHNPKYIPDFLKAIESHDLVIGSRYVSGVNVINWPMSRLILSYSANLYTRIVTGLSVRDATGGFKCFRRETLEAIDFRTARSDGYAFQIELNYRAWRRGFRIVEIPIVFVDRTAGTSKMSKNIIWEAVWMVWRLRLASLFGGRAVRR
ncbi:MAG: polyprenol monophosphomannose synthase [bacterium]